MQVHDLILRRDDTDAKGKRKRCPANGYFYEVRYKGGLIARSQTNPQTNACRALLARGIKGKARFWRVDKTSHDIESDIEKAAKFQLSEERRDGFRWRRYRNPVDCRQTGEVQEPSVVVAGKPSLSRSPGSQRIERHTAQKARRSERGEHTREGYSVGGPL